MKGTLAESSRENLTRKHIILYAFSLLGGGLSGMFLCILPFFGPTLGFFTVGLTHPQPRQAGKRGAIAGTFASAGLLLTLLASRLIIMPSIFGYAPLEEAFIYWAVSVIYTVGLSVLTATIIGRKRPPSDLAILEYLPLLPTDGHITIVCRSCGARQQIPIAMFSKSLVTSRQQLTEGVNQDRIINSREHSYDMSHLSIGTIGCISILILLITGIISNGIIGFIGVGDIIVYIVWNLTFVAVFYLISKPFFRLFGRRIPIWLVYCPECGERIPVATDGKVFFTAMNE
jgi:hypothetical protein